MAPGGAAHAAEGIPYHAGTHAGKQPPDALGRSPRPGRGTRRPENVGGAMKLGPVASGLIVGATAGALLMSPAHAAGDHWFGITAGASVPHGYFSDDAKTGTLIGFSYTRMLNGVVGVGADVERHGWEAKSRVNDPAIALYGPNSRYLLTAWQYMAHVMFIAPMFGHAAAHPYLIGGLGFYNPGFKLDTDLGRDSETSMDTGFHGGGGLLFPGPRGTTLDLFMDFHQYQDRVHPTPAAWPSAG